MPRERIANRRSCENFDLECAGMKYACTFSKFADGRICELFLSNHKNGSHADTAARDSAVVASIALQFGADIETLRKALLRDPRGVASGPLGGALDLIAQMDGST